MLIAPRTADSHVHERVALLSRLYAEQAEHGDTTYLKLHGDPATVAHHVNVFEWYAPYIEPGAAVLDWGCNHGPDSCLIRDRFGADIELHACDFAAEADFRVFRDFARPRYEQLTDALKLPYERETFDVLIGSGVLEHTAMDGEALKEVWRVLRPGGHLVVTYLPYAYSWDEWWRRNVLKRDYHRRLYTFRGFDRLLRGHGFEPLDLRLQGFVPNRIKGGRRPLWWRVLRPVLHPVVNALWEPVLRPLRYPFYTHSVLCAVARKFVIM